MKKVLSLILAVLFILPLFTSCTTAKSTQSAIIPGEGETVLYVSPTGDDANDGTFDKPLATLDGAKAKVRTILPTADGAVSVYFREGDYIMSAGVSFDEADSGKDGAPVKYAAYPDEKVRFIGGVKVDPSLITKADPDSSVTARVKDEAAKAALLQADVSSLIEAFPPLYSYDDTELNAEHPVEFYLGETAVIPARWPNDGTQQEFNYVTMGMDPEKPSTMYDDNVKVRYIPTIYYEDDTAERAATWSDESLENLYLTGSLQQSYIIDTFRVLKLDREAGSVTLTHGVTPNYTETKGGRAYFMNLPEEIDVPGESYIDRDAKIVYFYPTEDYDPDNVWLSTLEDDMLAFRGAAHLRFENLDFVYMRGNAIDAEGITDMTMEHCTLAHTSTQLAYLLDAENVHLKGCRMGDSAHGGIILMGGDRDTLTSAECSIEDCDIFDVNRDRLTYMSETQNDRFFSRAPTFGHHYAPAVNIFAVGTLLRGNKIHGTVGQAIHPMSNDIIIEQNEIFDCVTETSDMAAIYYYNNPTFLGLSIHDNYFHEIGGQTGSCQFSIYTDCGSMGPDIYNNLFVNAAGIDQNDPIRPKGVISLAQYAHIHNNIFVNAKAIFRYGDWSAGTGIRQSDWVLFLYDRGKYAGMGSIRHFSEVDFDSDIWHAKYDGTIWGNIYDYFSFDMLAALEACPDEKSVKNKAAGISPYQTNEMDNNVLVNVDLYVNDELDRSLKLHDNFMGGADIFTDAANGDYTLTEAGLALVRESCPDFDPAPFAEVGPQ